MGDLEIAADYNLLEECIIYVTLYVKVKITTIFRATVRILTQGPVYQNLLHSKY